MRHLRLFACVSLLFAVANPAVFGQEILAQIGPGRGIVVLVGDAGDPVEDLAKKSEATFFVQQPKTQADKLRVTLDKAGLLGSRVYVHDGVASLYLADDLADAVVVPENVKLAESEVLRVLRPEGKAIVGKKSLTKAFRKGTDEWSHPYRAPDNNPQSQDTVMKRPFLTHYMAEPWYCPLPMQSVISGGRVFKVFGDRSSAKPQEPLIDKLLCLNAFNGVQLWQRDLSPGFMIHRNTLIATPDTLYVGDDKSCKLIDPATGKVRDEIVVPADKSDGPVWKWMAYENGVLYALVGEKETPDEPLKGERYRGAGWPWWRINNYKFGIGKNLLAIDPKSKKILWHHREDDPIDARGMAMLKGRLYYFSDGKFLACLNAKTGKVLWKNVEKEMLDAVGPTKSAQHPLLGFASSAFMKCSEHAVYLAGPNRPMLVCASAKDGKLLWKKDCSVRGKYPTEGGNVGLIIRPDGVYALGQGRINEEMSSFKLEPLTGKVLATFPSRDRCTRATGCLDTIFTRGGKGGSTAAFDVTSQEPRMGTLSPMRPACQDGVLTAHGYLFWGPWQCRCDMTQLGVISLGPGGKFDYTAKAADKDRLETYPAFAIPSLARDVDWPTYRRDNARSVTIDDAVPDKARLVWTWNPQAATLPTAPIIANGKVIVGGQDGVIRAIRLESGKLAWSAYTGGPIKYPPAAARTRLFVGSGDGYIYCLDPYSGKTYWRFRTAPVERMIPIYGSLSSTWPVGSGVLVDNGVVYGAAGISNFDGTHVFALDAVTGKIKWQQHSASHGDDDLPNGGVSVQGPMLLHNGAVHFASGNTPPIAAYNVLDGKFTPSTNGRGKDLYLRDGKVTGTGYPLYWRPEDDQFLSTMDLETPAGILQVGCSIIDPNAPAKFALLAPHKRGEKAREIWSNPVYHEIAAVAIARNAVILTGLNRDKRDPSKFKAGICAVSLADGKILWQEALPGVPTAWGLALASRGNDMIVTLMDGRVLAFSNEK